jgi:hypothetical protein
VARHTGGNPESHLDRCAGDHLRSGVSQPDGEAGSDARSGTPAEFAAAIEEQRVKIAAINMTIQPPAR